MKFENEANAWLALFDTEKLCQQGTPLAWPPSGVNCKPFVMILEVGNMHQERLKWEHAGGKLQGHH